MIIKQCNTGDSPLCYTGGNMEKKEFQKIVKDRLKIEGFRTKGNLAYKLIDEDYLIGVMLDHNPFCKGYFIEYGALYLPDDLCFPTDRSFPYQGYCDWDDRFIFTTDADIDLGGLRFEEMCWIKEEKLTQCFEYDIRTSEELIEQLDINIQRKLKLLEDKTYVLEYYKNNVDSFFIHKPMRTIEKLLNLYDFDREEVYRKRKAWETMYD